MTEGKLRTMTIRVQPRLLDKIERAATRDGREPSQWVRRLAEIEFDREARGVYVEELSHDEVTGLNVYRLLLKIDPVCLAAMFHLTSLAAVSEPVRVKIRQFAESLGFLSP